MLQKNKIMLIMLLVFGLVLAGCSGIDGRQNLFGPGNSDSSSSSNLRGGVELSFQEGTPPREMFKGQEYTFGFIFTNEQRHDITDMRIRTRGFDRGFVNGLAESYQINNIPRANEISGPARHSSLIVSGVRVDGFSGDYRFDPTFDYCYTAKTTFRQQLCIPNSRNQCDLNVQPNVDQNGPVRVSVGQIQMAGNQIILPIEFSNSQSGQVVSTCFNTDDFNRNYRVNEVRLGSQVGQCRPTSSDSFSLINQRSTVFCEFSRQDSSDQAYASQLNVEIEYLYQNTLRKDIVVRDLSRFTN